MALAAQQPLGPARRGEAGHRGTAATPARGGATAGPGPRSKHRRPRAIAPPRPTPSCWPAPIRLICYEPRWLHRLSPLSGWGHVCGWLRLFVGANVTDGWPSCAGDCTSLGDTDRPVRCRGAARPGLAAGACAGAACRTVRCIVWCRHICRSQPEQRLRLGECAYRSDAGRLWWWGGTPSPSVNGVRYKLVVRGLLAGYGVVM